MWPLNTRAGGRRTRRGAALHAAWLLCLALASHADEGVAATPSLREKDVRRAEKVLAQLRLLDEAAARDDGEALRARSAKLYPGLFVAVADMRESDLKTDLDTAVYLYERVVRTWLAAGSASSDCAGERPDIYLPLCLDQRGRTARGLLLAKARLHARWAEAVVKTFGGRGDADTSGALSEMKAARENDLLIAARIVGALKTLEEVVNVPATHAEYQERGTASAVSFHKLEADCSDALDVARALLSWLPRSPTFYRLSNARRGYSDGLFWHRKVYQSKKLSVSANAFAPDPLQALRLDANQVGYAVVVNWKSALKHTRLAEQSLPGSRLR